MTTISFGQAILLLIDHYKNDALITQNLKEIYIQGIKSNNDQTKIQELFQKSALANHYEISYTEKSIDEDVSRRYFETHLAYEMLATALNKLNFDELQNHYNLLYRELPEDKRVQFDEYVEGKRSPKDNGFATEYTDAFKKVTEHENYKNLTATQKQILTLVLKSAWLGVIHATVPVEISKLPLNLYGMGFFSEQNRGRIAKQKPELPSSELMAQKVPFFSKHFGLMKNYMPVPRDDVAYAEEGFTFLKPSDQNTFNPQAEWPRKNFSSLVHPFSCSISGTTLCQLRFMKKLHDENRLTFESAEKFSDFLKCFMSGLLFNSGGHVYNEFLAVLELPEIRDSFSFMEGFDQINAKTLLLDNNESAFNKALEDTIAYTQVVLQKEEVHEELRRNSIN